LQSGLVSMMIGICIFCKTQYRKREKKRKFCSLSCASRFNKNGVNFVQVPRHSKRLAEFVGICLGDGCAWGYQVSITLNAIADKEYIHYVEELAKALFIGATVTVVKRKDNALDVRISSRKVVLFMKKMGIVSKAKFIPQWIMGNPTYAKACIRGLFDTEGSISFKKYKSGHGMCLYKQLNFRNANIKLVQFVRDNLVILGLKPTTTLKKSLYVSNHLGIDNFRRDIGFSNPKLLERSLIRDFDSYSLLTK